VSNKIALINPESRSFVIHSRIKTSENIKFARIQSP